MKKVCRIVGVIIGCVLAFGQAQAQIPFGQKIDDGQPITFYPVMVRSQELVKVKLITSAVYRDRYIALEQSVMENDWRPILSMDGNVSNPGECTVLVRPNWYSIGCWLVGDRRVIVQYANAQSVREVIDAIKDFSKNRLKQ